MQKKLIISVNGPVIEARGEADFAMHDMVLVGEYCMMGEVIKLNKDIATIQVYEETSGLRIGEEVIGTEAPLNISLGPGLIGNVFDGIGRSLEGLQEISGDFLKKEFNNVSSIDKTKEWHFVPMVQVGNWVSFNTILGEVKETEVIKNRIMNPHKIDGEVIYIAQEGNYKATDVIARIKTDSR